MNTTASEACGQSFMSNTFVNWERILDKSEKRRIYVT